MGSKKDGADGEASEEAGRVMELVRSLDAAGQFDPLRLAGRIMIQRAGLWGGVLVASTLLHFMVLLGLLGLGPLGVPGMIAVLVSWIGYPAALGVATVREHLWGDRSGSVRIVGGELAVPGRAARVLVLHPFLSLGYLLLLASPIPLFRMALPAPSLAGDLVSVAWLAVSYMLHCCVLTEAYLLDRGLLEALPVGLLKGLRILMLAPQRPVEAAIRCLAVLAASLWLLRLGAWLGPSTWLLGFFVCLGWAQAFAAATVSLVSLRDDARSPLFAKETPEMAE